ncbi:glycosyltransferase family 4 protein [Salibacteraceae bacterium]|nr:glycosyltransferase family 4 protein [Salibacteraceae bacterium]MDB0002447.1 glycosyltransferase family 4 protein [Salibacteraceae bacterium]MDB4104595.1 glycosyltransferase family 4 protein [Salibacteraceae bacterium]MDB9709425.1 glycosyltransferase family 4 protein [Salibacteraceae bacterium]MDC1303944.1 glycosyltransferase family 4 protein [Salibacteraceae bacterium]
MKILILSTVWLEPNSTAAGSRMLQIIRLFQQLNWEVHYASTAAESPFAIDLSGIGVNKLSIKVNDIGFDALIQNLAPDMVIYDRSMTEEQFGWRVAKYVPNALRILDTEDLHCLRYARQRAFQEKRVFKDDDLLSDVAIREVAAILRSDITLMISAVEMDLLQRVFKVDAGLLHYLPFMVDAEEQKSDKTFSDRQHFVSIGNFHHAPNLDAVKYLKSDIWPLIRKQMPNAELHVYGAYPTQQVLEMNDPSSGFIVKGRAEDAFEVIGNARVLLAPLRFGAGLKGKLLNAMQCGTPNVTSSIGAEAMHGQLPWNGFIADDAAEYAEKAVQLYQDEKLWTEAQQNGSIILKGIFDAGLHSQVFIERLKAIQKNLTKHRSSNFMGQMLKHHTMRSTEYMSKWIEAKNRLA